MAQPSIPDTEQIARQLQAVDLSGGASTADRGSNSARAIASALTPVGKSGGGNLLKAYAAWKERQAQLEGAGITGQPLDAKKALDVGPDDVRRAREKHARRAAHRLDQARQEAALAGPALEEHAMAKGRKTYRKHLQAEPEVAASQAAFTKYGKHGGKLGLAAFRRRLA